MAWRAALLGLLPTIAMVLVHLLVHPAGLEPTGFLQYDQPYYMANAREFFDGGFHLLYGLPYADSPATPRVYFQPQIFLLGVVQHVTGLPPGWLFLGFGLAAGLACLRLLATLFTEATGTEPESWRLAEWLAWITLCWGGGLFVLAGLVTGGPSVEALLRFDPEDGWWLLNLGRNFLYPMEAYYHLLTFAVVLMLGRRRWGAALALLVLLSASHPFTGLKALLVVLAWSGLERLILSRREVPLWLPVAAAALVALHLGYYMGYLGQSADHRALVAYWKDMPWTLSLGNALLAFALVAWFAYRRLRDHPADLGDPRSRLWAVLAFVTFGLAEHDLLIDAHQPIHFVRGYIYTALFFLGLPALVALLRRLSPRKLALAGLLALFLADNTAWYAIQTVRAATREMDFGWYLTQDRLALFAELNRTADVETLLIADEAFTAYLALTYTPVHAWFSHGVNTPFLRARWQSLQQFFADGVMPPEWQDRRLLILAGSHWWDKGDPPWWNSATMRRVADLGETVLVERPGHGD